MYDTIPTEWDSDDDDINDYDEVNNCVYGEDNDECTDPRDDDSDNDGLSDGYEIDENPSATDQMFWDTDGGGVGDGVEIITDETNPNNAADDNVAANDDDDDGLTNGEEAVWGTEIDNPDTDGDGLEDGDEVDIYGTSPTELDSDYDEINIY